MEGWIKQANSSGQGLCAPCRAWEQCYRPQELGLLLFALTPLLGPVKCFRWKSLLYSANPLVCHSSPLRIDQPCLPFFMDWTYKKAVSVDKSPRFLSALTAYYFFDYLDKENMDHRQQDLFPDLPDVRKYLLDIPELVAEWQPTNRCDLLPEDISYCSGIRK